MREALYLAHGEVALDAVVEQLRPYHQKLYYTTVLYRESILYNCIMLNVTVLYCFSTYV